MRTNWNDKAGRYYTEQELEEYLRDEVKKLGGTAFKFVSPGNQGVPDRLVCLPGGRVFFIELKSPKGTGRASAMQQMQQERLRKLGCNVFMTNNFGMIDMFIADMRERLSK